MSRNLILGLVGAALAALIAALLLWWRRRQRSTIRDALAAIAVERLENVLVPDGMGGEIHVEHLVLTARGILVLDVKPYQGVIFASERMDQWTAIGASGRSSFPNPLGSLYDRVAAVSQLVRDIDVRGFVVFPALADFSKGRPADVLLPEDLVADFAKPDAAEVGKLIEAFAQHWDRIRAASQPASA